MEIHEALGIVEDTTVFILTCLPWGRPLWKELWNPGELGSSSDIPTDLGDLLHVPEPHFPPL